MSFFGEIVSDICSALIDDQWDCIWGQRWPKKAKYSDCHPTVRHSSLRNTHFANHQGIVGKNITHLKLYSYSIELPRWMCIITMIRSIQLIRAVNRREKIRVLLANSKNLLGNVEIIQKFVHFASVMLIK